MLGLTKVMIGGCAAVLLAGGGVAGWRASHGSPTLPLPTCGSVTTHLLSSDTQLLSAKPGALACFSAAARNCRAGSIAVNQMGVDAGTRYVFVIEPGTEPCQVTEQSQFYMVSGGLRHGPVKTVACQRSAVTTSGVTLSCGGRGILIPVELRMSVDRGEAAS